MSQAVTISYEFSSTATSTTATATATSIFEQPFPSVLELSPLQELDRLLSDVPFFCTGFLAITVLFFCLALGKLRKPLIYIIGAALVAFISAIVDLVALLHGSADSTFAALVSREMGLASFTGLLYFSFWIYCDATPPFKSRSIDLSLPGPATETDRPAETAKDSAKQSPTSTWPGPGPVRAILMYGSLMACFAVMALQMIWRFGWLFSLNRLVPEYRADAISEICLALLFAGKVFTDSLTAQDDIPWWRIWRASGPMIFAMLTQMGIAIGNLIVVRFSETCLGRFGQAIVVYSVMLTLLLTTFLETSPQDDRLDQPTETVLAPPASIFTDQRRPSFPGIDWRASFRTFRVSPPNATTPSPPTLPPVRPPLQRRNTAASRVSQWIQSKVPGPNKDAGGDDRLRLWDAGQLEKGRDQEKDQERTTSTVEDISPMTRSPPAQREASTPYTSSLPYVIRTPTFRNPPPAPVTGAKLANSALPDFAQVNVSQNDGGLASPSKESSIAERERRNTIASSRSAASQWSLPSRAVGDRIDSPVYGLEGIVRTLSKEDAKQQKSFAEFTGLVGSLPRGFLSQIPAVGPSKSAATKRFSRRRSSAMPPPQKPPPTALAPQPILPRVVLPPAQPNRQSSRPEELSDGSKSLSTTPGQESILTSEFSFSQFPTPPAAVALESAYYDDDNTSIEEGSPTVTGHPTLPSASRRPGIGAPPKGGLPPTPSRRQMTSDSLLVDDIPFTLVPPKMPAAMADSGRSRQDSFPSTTRGSDLSNIFAGQASIPAGQNTQDGTRINVTSFIGAAAHLRQDSDRSLGLSSVIPEEEERRSVYSTDGEPAVVSTVRRGNSLVRPRLVDQASLASSPSATSTPGRTSPTSRLANALPTNPRPPAASTGRTVAMGLGGSSSSGRSAATQPLRVRKQGMQISGPFPTEDIPLDFDRPRPPPRALR